ALRHEAKPFNIRVSLVEAGFLKTDMRHHRQLAARRIDAYDPWRQRALNAIHAAEEKAPGPQLVATTVRAIVERDAPRLRYRMGRQGRWVTWLRRFLPGPAYLWGVRRPFHLDA